MDFVTQFQANQMVQNIREAFIENLETVNWMDSQTKQAAKEKVRSLVYNDLQETVFSKREARPVELSHRKCLYK